MRIWNIGDVFAYKLVSDLAKEKGLLGRYFLIEKIDEYIFDEDKKAPIVYVKLSDGQNLPSKVEDYNQLEFVQTWFTKYEERFWPIDMKNPEDDIHTKSMIDYQVDEYGYLPQYRIVLFNIRAKEMLKNLVYVGNFSNATSPSKEFIPHAQINIPSVFWKNNGESFEIKLIERYYGHNMRELPIYSS